MNKDRALAKQQIKTWYHAYSEDIYRFIYMMIGDTHKARDLMHDTFVKAYINFDTFQGYSHEKSWLYSIARNMTIDEMRKSKPIRYMLDRLPFVPSNEPTPQEIVEIGETEALLYRAIKNLRRPYQEVVYFRKIKGLSIKETAEILGWNESRVKNMMFKASEALKKQLIKEGYVHGEA